MVCLLSSRDARQRAGRASEVLQTEPDVRLAAHRDRFGNLAHRFTAPPGMFSIICDGLIEMEGAPDPVEAGAREVPVQDLPADCLEYLRGSRYCETDKLSQVAWDMFGTTPAGWTRVQAICDFVHTHLKFDYMAARVTRTAEEAFAERTGVCRDFAHLAITLCRCMNIPARYVNGYLGDFGVEEPADEPPDFSAWIEVFLEGRWHTFDPRNNTPRIGRIIVARGHDAVDVPMIYSFGPHRLEHFQVWTREASDAEAAEADHPGRGLTPQHLDAPPARS